MVDKMETLGERARGNPRTKFLVIAAGLGLVALTAGCGGTALGEGEAKAVPKKEKEGTVKEAKLATWDPIIDTFVEENLQVKANVKTDYERGRDFFAVGVTYHHGTAEDFKGVMILPLSSDLPEPIMGVDQTIFYGIRTASGALFPFPENSNMTSFNGTPRSIIGREVSSDYEKSFVNRDVTVVQVRVKVTDSQGVMKAAIGTVFLERHFPERKDAFLQDVREELTARRMLLEIREGVPLVLQHFPARIIEKDGKIIYAMAGQIA